MLNKLAQERKAPRSQIRFVYTKAHTRRRTALARPDVYGVQYDCP